MKHVFTLIVVLFAAISTTLFSQELRFHPNGTFKIAQFTDVHFIKGDSRSEISIKAINQVLDTEKPDVVIFTGDIVTCKPAKEGWDQILNLVIQRHIPFAVTLGNHDDEQDLTREELSRLITSYPYNQNKAKVKGVKGYLNTVLPIKSAQGKKNKALLYLMDSNNYSTLDTVKGYGWFTPCQIQWYKKQSIKYNRSHKNEPLPSLAFFHIALPEYREAFNKAKENIVGKRLEEECSPNINSGMFYSMLQRGDIFGIFVGHDHINDYLVSHYGIALAYGRFTGSATTYTNDSPNGARIIELLDGKRSFNTWIRLHNGEVIDRCNYPEDFNRLLPRK